MGVITIIVACEIAFWVVLAAGLVARYGLRRRRLGAILLACVPLVDVVLLVATVLDLSRGARADCPSRRPGQRSVASSDPIAHCPPLRATSRSGDRTAAPLTAVGR